MLRLEEVTGTNRADWKQDNFATTSHGPAPPSYYRNDEGRWVPDVADDEFPVTSRGHVSAEVDFPSAAPTQAPLGPAADRSSGVPAEAENDFSYAPVFTAGDFQPDEYPATPAELETRLAPVLQVLRQVDSLKLHDSVIEYMTCRERIDGPTEYKEVAKLLGKVYHLVCHHPVDPDAGIVEVAEAFSRWCISQGVLKPLTTPQSS